MKPKNFPHGYESNNIKTRSEEVGDSFENSRV